MIEEPKIREKRFVLEEQDELKSLWTSQAGQTLTLTYAYSQQAIKKVNYVETVQVAIETFNKLGFARLKYDPMDMGSVPDVCSLDLPYLKSKYKNQIIFKIGENITDIEGCGTRASLLYNKQDLNYFDDTENNQSDIKLQPFSSVICNVENNFFLNYGPGIILHEINHLLGVKHAHFAKDSDSILTVNIPQPDIEAIYWNDTLAWNEKLRELSKVINIYPYTPYQETIHYTPASLFSIQHYAFTELEPYLSVNKTRINQILTEFNVTAELRKDYFYLYEKYAGNPVLYTYQDLAALAQASYSIAPDSLAGLRFSLPSYYLVEGIYMPNSDQRKLIHLIQNLRQLEEFSYPILAQDKIRLTTYHYNNFSAPLYDSFKIVSLDQGLITCFLTESGNTSLSLTLDSDCNLKGESRESGVFPFKVTLTNNVTSIQREVILIVKQRVPAENRVLLGNPQANYLLAENATAIDLIAVCRAVALPRGRRLNCQWDELSDNMPIEGCSTVANRSDHYNFTVIFINRKARKTCHIQVLNFLNWTRQVEGLVLNKTNELLLEDAVVQASLRKQEYFTEMGSSQPIYDKAFFQPLLQCSHLLTIPLLQGFFEGIIDACRLGHAPKTLLKFIPRIILVALGYTNFLSGGLAALASILTDFMQENLKGFVSRKLENYINLLFFLVVTELEYAPSNLWQLSGSLEIFPESIALLNKLFVQMALAPAFKTAAYLTTQSVMKCLSTSAEEMDSSKQQTFSANADFFNALSVARSTVFSKKILRPFAFFSRPAVNNQASAVVEDIDAERSYIAKIA